MPRGRHARPGQINPMLNLCEVVAERSDDIFITVVVTEEWLGFIGSMDKPPNISFAAIPNVVPSERVRGEDVTGFAVAVLTKMEEPFERLLDEFSCLPPPTVIIADAFLPWAAEVAGRRKIPLASLWTMSASVYTVFYHFDLLVQNGHFPIDLSVNGDTIVDYIPGLSSVPVGGTTRIGTSAGDVRREGVGCGVVPSAGGPVSSLCWRILVALWWNSTKEAVLAGLPMLTSPILMDQLTDAKAIVEDWRIGWRVWKGVFDEHNLTNSDEIAELVGRFMNLESSEREELTKNAKELQKSCEREFANGQSFQTNVDGFVGSILQYSHLHALTNCFKC
ncbi:UNVERIFIED_CONTAM: UDP-glycosyltransferase 87A1 [Sesamum latifolium]|uniref:UDP-glycosyltransferase 87A1 n=1 Tax=Sesamum latifolium TaxID=2727402 RepID=A0AAW2Y2C7_9LAMI